ncbi:ATPase, T2SS/T4P/T4SS family [Acerihabitans sp. TG2]|uniref:GspE/PulE family protein n=1 Tax=Acerihabitans sp. TG2 TaxID=3096008 RepID=UPI002B224128|nr:ATPase, T2SS/T4P/T4SS family [Acerihabitans sp. TG2]MEA9392191.1 ATPase, T2SS/T4P/T4SS family [Acerihabitans sp. TG2]
MSALELVPINTGASYKIIVPNENSNWYIPATNEVLRGICIFDEENKFLHICDGKQSDINVISFMDRLDRQDVQYEINITNYESISAAYTHEVENHGDATTNQSIVLSIIKDAMKKGSSDIHLIDRDGKSVIKFRINGNLIAQPLSSRTDRVKQLIPTIYPSMLDVSDTHHKEGKKQDGRIRKEILKELGLIGARVSTTPTDVGSLMVIRLMKDNSKSDLTIKMLGYADYHLAMMRKMQKKRRGIIILSGETGSGKTTTLECIMRELVVSTKGTKHIFTIENPPENSIDDVNHTPVLCEDFDDEAEVSASWARSISSALRLDPDIVVVGEARDKASAQAVFRAGMTGHQVYATVHANDSTSILDRLEDEGIQMSLLSNPKLVIGLVNQCLVPVTCKSCRIKLTKENENKLEEDLLFRIKERTEYIKGNIYLMGPGCNQCNYSGIEGRTVVAEIIMPSFELLNVFKKEGNAAARHYWINTEHGKPLSHHLIQKINSGDIDPDIAEQYACLLDEE